MKTDIIETVTSRQDRKIVLIVDDVPENVAMVSATLSGEYATKVAINGSVALAIANGDVKPDLILLDVSMPGMDGYEVCRALRGNVATSEIPVIFLTSHAREDDESKGFGIGGVDYIHKPYSPSVILARVRTHIALKEARDQLRSQNVILEDKIQERTRELASMQEATIMAMALLAETRDTETGGHLLRTRLYVKILANWLAKLPGYSEFQDPAVVDLIYKSAPLHDIGKVGIPDRILLKPGKLDADEYEIMKTHTTLGRDAIAKAEQFLDAPISFLRYAKEIAYSHQEKWDGSGYPEGLAGDAIPASARLMALADVYDALISKRVYKEAFSHEKAAAIIIEGRCRHFDPHVVDAFVAQADAFQDIAGRY